jgi:DNA-directed RNA polymerase specialized sigma24 family protein
MSWNRDSDDDLAAIAAGDADAFARWLAHAELPLRRALRRFCTVVDTEAVLQEALLRVWQVAPRCQRDGRAHGLLRLAMRITQNLARSEARRHRLLPVAAGDDLPEPDVAPAPVPDPTLRQALARCRDQLPPQPGRALLARLDDSGLHGDHELAARLGMRTNTFLQNITRARSLLAECLRRAGIDLDLELA